MLQTAAENAINLQFNRKNKGQYFTPERFANQIVNRTFELHKMYSGDSKDVPFICDPNVGEGVFLNSAYEYLINEIKDNQIVSSNLYGVDIDSDTLDKSNKIAIAKHNTTFQLYNGNSLAPASFFEYTSSIQSELINPNDNDYNFKPFNWNNILNNLPNNKKGFDLVVGNPPWEVLRPNDKEFFTRYNTDFRKLKRKEQDNIKRELLADPKIKLDYVNYCQYYKDFSHFVKKSGFYKMQGPVQGLRAWGTSINLYKMALELSIKLLSPNGTMALIVPSSFLGELGGSSLRKYILESMSLLEVWSFPSEAKIFKNVDQNFSVLFIGNHIKEDNTTFISYEKVDKKELKKSVCSVNKDLLKSSSPKTYAFLNLKHRSEINLLEKIITHPLLGEKVNGEKLAEPTREVDETNHRHWFTESSSEIPLLKGRDILQFGFSKYAPSKYIEREFIEIHSTDWKFKRIAWRDISRPSSKKRLIASLIPEGYALGNSLNYFKPFEDDYKTYYLLAILNSTVAEYRIRQLSTNSHINMFVMDQLNVPRLPKSSQLYQEIVSLSRLVYENGILSHLDEKRVLLDYLICLAYNLSENNIKTLCRSLPKLEPNYESMLLNHYEKSNEE